MKPPASIHLSLALNSADHLPVSRLAMLAVSAGGGAGQQPRRFAEASARQWAVGCGQGPKTT
jgi:hypothetical protein